MTTETATPNQADASTAFLRAARAGHIDKIISLLEQGVDINVSNANGLNAIHLASKDGHVEVVRELLQRGAAIDAATKKGNTALHIASLAGQEAVVKLLVQNGAQVNIQSQNGFTPLYMAAQENHDGVVKFLLSNGANQSLATEDGFTPLAVAMQQGHEKVVAVLLEADTRGRVRLPALHIAAKKDDVKAANLLLENEHNPDVTSKSGFTPLHIAAHYGNESVARLLLAKGADVNCAAKHNICPLHVAAKWGKENMVSLLCDNGANVEARTRDGLTPLHCAARSGHERVVESLLDRGAPITSKSKNGLAPLHMAAQGDHSEAARVLLSRRAPVDDVTVDYLTALHVAAHCGHAKVAKLLLDRNADANARALNGFTPLHIACKKNRIKVVELLLKYGASIQATTESGLTPLHVASFMGCMNIVIYLLQHEANPDVPTVRGETPLHLAARANQTDIIRILLRNGAAVEAKARERQTPLHIASRLGNVDIAVLLLQHGADVRAMTADHYNALHIAAKQHNHDVAAALIEHNAPLTATTKKGFTALHLAAKYGNLKVANLLLAHGASPDQAGKNGMTPLHIAAQYDQQAVANTLLEKGADAKAVAKNGHTPLHIASRKNQMETAATLLEYGALTNAESKAGFTPLHLAAQQGHTEMCSLLLEHGAEVDQQAKNGLAALHLAAQEDRVPVAQLLVKNGAEVDICTKGGYTPLHIASHYGQANMVRFLLESGASVKAQTSHGYTALHHAAQQGHINIVNILLEHKADANATTVNGQTPLDIASKLGYVTVMETLKEVSEPSMALASQDKYKVVAPETMLETFMSDSEEEGGEDTILNDQPYRYLTADDMKSLGDDSLPIDVTKDERTESALSHKNIMEISQTSVNGIPYQPQQEVVVKSISRYSTAQAPEGYCYNVDLTQPKKKLQWKNFLVSFLVDARGGALRGCRGGGVRVIVPPSSAQQPTRITCRYLKPSRINHMPPLMEGEALASRVLEMGPVAAKFLGPVILEVPHYASLRGKEREIVILRSDNGTSWREHNADATDDVVQDILNETLEIEETNEEEKGWDAPRVTRILTHDFPQYFAVISRIRQEVHAIGPEGGMVSSSVVPQVQAVFPQGALTKKIKVGLQAQIIDSELTAKLLGRGVAVSPVVTVEPRRRKFHKAITLSMPAPRPHTQGMTNQYSTSSAPTLRLLCSISGVFRKRSLEGGTNRAHWEDVTENTPLTFVNDCVSFTTTVSARYWLIDCRHIEDATKMATELYREAIHVPFMARFVVYAKRTDECQAQLRMFCVTDDKEDKALERIERFIQVAKSRDVEVHEGKPVHLEFGGNLVPVAKSGEHLSIPFRAFRENRMAFPVMIKTQDLEPICRCQFMRDPKVPKGEPSPTPIAVLNIMVPDDLPVERTSPLPADLIPRRTEEQELAWRQRLSDPRLEDICNLLGKDWVALAYELGVSVATVNQIQAKRITASEQAQLMLKLWKTQSGTKAQDNSLELALCRIGRDDIIAPQSELSNERRIQRNIYQERQESEEIEAYKAEEDNKLKENIYDDDEITERMRSEDLDQDEAKYSPEEKSIVDKSDMDRTPTPSEESEEDEDIKRSVAERKVQITKKLSSSKIPSSKQKKELREEIIEIKTQIKPDIKKFQDIEQQIKAESKLDQMRFKTSPDYFDPKTDKVVSIQKEAVVELSKEEIKQERTVEQFRKFDPSSPAKPTPKHLQRHMRNESMRFPSGDFSNVTITPRKSITTEMIETKQSIETKTETFTKEEISQKEIDRARVEEKLDDGERSPELVTDEERDVAEATLKDKINAFETKISGEPPTDTAKTVKLTKEALKRHTQEQDHGLEYTQAFVRDQAKQLSNLESQKIFIETEKHTETVKSVRNTIQRFDSKVKQEDKLKQFPKTMRTDSTLVQVSSEEDSEFLKKSTDSETETESQTTIKVEKDKKSKFEFHKDSFEKKADLRETSDIKKKDSDKDKKTDDDDKKDDERVSIKEHGIEIDESQLKVSDEEITETKEENVSLEEQTKEKVETQQSIASTKSDLSKRTKTDSMGSDIQDIPGRKVSQESPLPSGIDKTDSLADLQQSTERDVSFVSQTESKIYSKDSKHRSDSLDEASQFSDLEDQIGMSPAHKPSSEKTIKEARIIESEEQISIIETSRDQTLEFLKYETEHSAQIHSSALTPKDSEKVPSKESPVISAKARQFIETVPEDDSVQECFFSKRIYSDSLEDSDHTDSRRHSEADSLKSDQSDIKAKISSSDFDERAEYEGTADSGSGFGDEKFEESIGFTSIKIDPKALESQKQDSDSASTQLDELEEPDVVFKKMVPKRHARTESVSISKLSDLQDIVTQELPVAIQEFQMIITEAEDVDKSSDKDEHSDKISSESSREIEVSERKSSDGISDRISSEDAVTDKKTSSEEEPIKDNLIYDQEKPKEITKIITDTVKDIQKIDTTTLKRESGAKAEETKRQSVSSVGSGSVSELRLEEKRLSDAHSITESRDYTFEESEDDIGTQETHKDAKEKVESKQEVESKIKPSEKPTELLKLAKLTHGDSLDDVEGFPEDHVAEYVHKLPHIQETSSAPDKHLTSQFLIKERDEQVKCETDIREMKILSEKLDPDKIIKAEDKTQKNKLTEQESDEISSSIKSKEISSSEPLESITVTTHGEEGISKLEQIRISDDKKIATEHRKGPAGEEITITTVTEVLVGPSGEELEKITETESTKYPSGKEAVSVKVSENIRSHKTETDIAKPKSIVEEIPSLNGEIQKEKISSDIYTSEHLPTYKQSDEKELSASKDSVKIKSEHLEMSEKSIEVTLPKSLESYEKSAHQPVPKPEKVVTLEDKLPLERETISTKIAESIPSHSLETSTSTMESSKKITEMTPATKAVDEPTKRVDAKVALTEKLDTKLLTEKKTEDIISSTKSLAAEPIPETETESFVITTHRKEIISGPETPMAIEKKIGDLGEEITVKTVTEHLRGSSGEDIVRTTVTETVKHPSGKESVSTKVSESIKQKITSTILGKSDKFEQLDKDGDKIIGETIRTSMEEKLQEEKVQKSAEDEKVSTTTETVIGLTGEEITTMTVTVTKILPTGEEAVKTTITETTKYPSGQQTVSTRVLESIQSHKEMVFTTSAFEALQSDTENNIQGMLSTSKDLTDKKDIAIDTKEDSKTGPAGETIKTTIVTETTKIPSGEKIKTTTTEVTKFPSGEESISTRVSESIKTFEQQSQIIAVKKSKQLTEHETAFQTAPTPEKPEVLKKTTFSEIEDHSLSKVASESLTGTKTLSKDLTSTDSPETANGQVKPVIDNVLQKGTMVATARSPVPEKDSKIISKEILETEKRSYDAKVPQKEERRHSCISPAISLERIAESEVEMEDEVEKLEVTVSKTTKDEDMKAELKKSDSAMKQMADNIEIIIKQASEDLDISSEEPALEEKEMEEKVKELQGEVSVDSIIEEAVQTVEGYLDETANKGSEEVDVKKEVIFENTKLPKERPGLIKSLSRDSGEIVIMPKKKQSRTFSVQSSPDEVEEQIYTDSESDMDKAKVLEIIEPTSDIDGKLPASSFDIKKIRTDSLDDADDFPEKEAEYFEDGGKYDDPEAFSATAFKDKGQQDAPCSSIQQDLDDDKFTDKFVKKTHFVDSILRSDLVSKSTTESSVTTVISTLTKSSDEDQKSVLEDATSADLSKISGADLMKDPSKTSLDTKDESRIEDHSEDRGTPDLSKKSLDLTKDYSKSSIDSKDTSRDFATNELSKDSTVDLTKDYSKASIDSVKESSRSIDEKTFSEEQSSFDFSKTLASDASDAISKCKEFIEEERSASKVIHISTSSSQETSIMTESKLFSEQDEKSFEKTKISDKTELEKGLLEDILKVKDRTKDEDKKSTKAADVTSETENKKKLTFDDKNEDEDSEVPDISELNRRCSNLLEDISAQGALIRIDSSHVVHDLSSKFSKTPPPSPVDLIMKERVKRDESASDKHTGLQPKSSEPSLLDANRQSPRASSAGDSLTSETEAHQSEILTEDLKAASIDSSKSPTKHLADDTSFVNVDKPTITSGAKELVDRTIEKSIDVIDQIKKEMEEELHKSTSSDTFYSESRIETSTSSSSIHKTVEGTQLKFQSIDPEAVMSDMISKFGTTGEYTTVLSHKETETRKISGQEFFLETKQVSSSDDDSLIIKTETSHELRGQEHEVKEKMTVKKEGDETETSQKKMEKAHEATAKRSDKETKTVFKSTDDTDIVKVEIEFSEQGLYRGRQTKSEEKMTALKDETVKKTHEVKISERDLSHEQWGKEYFTQPGELEDIKEDEDSKSRIAFVDSSLKIVEKDEIVCSVEFSEKGQVISSKVEHHREESVIESKEHDDLSSDASHIPSFKSESAERRDSSETSPKSKSKSFKKDDEVYEVDFIKEIRVSTSPVKSTFSRTGSQDTHSESEVVPELPHDDKLSETPKKEPSTKSVVKLSHSDDLILEVSVTGEISSADESLAFTSIPESAPILSSSQITKSTEADIIETKSGTIETSTKTTKIDMSPSTLEISDDISTTSKDVMIKSGESIDTECMVKSLEFHESEVLQKSMDSTVSAETLHASEFSTEADSAFLTGTDYKKEEIKLVKEKSTEDICSSGYDTDFSSAEFHGMKLETDRVALDSLISTQPLADLSVLEKTIDEVKQSLEAAQVEIISEKSDGSIKYKQSPSEFQFKILISPERPEVIKEEPHHADIKIEKMVIHEDKTIFTVEKDEKLLDSQKSDSVSHKVSSQDETTFSDEDKDTIHIKQPSPPLEADISIRSDSGPHSILDTESEGLSDRNDSSKGSPEVKLRAPKHVKSQLGVIERRSASEIESWSSSGESHYHSFEHSESRPLSSDVEVMMTAQSGTDYETALTSHDLSSQSLRTSKEYFTAGSSLASRDSMKSLDSDGSSHVASIDISDASETLVPSAHELKEELMESSTYVEQFLHEPEKEISKVKEISDEEISGEDEEFRIDNTEPLGKMKRSHEMRFQPKDMVPEHFPLAGTSESIEFDDDSLKEKEGSDTTISSQLKTDEILSSSISKLDMSSSQSQIDLDKEEVQETISKSSVHSEHAVPFSVTKVKKPQREFVDVDSDIIPVGSAEYEEIEKFGSVTTKLRPSRDEDTEIKRVIQMDESIPKSVTTQPIQSEDVKEECVKKVIKEISTIPFPIAEKPLSQRELVDIEDDIIPVGSKQYEEILKSKSDSSVPKTKAEKSGAKTPEAQLESKQSSTSSLKTHEHLSTPHTPLSVPSQSSLSTENGREYVLDDMYDISETPELKSDIITESSRSELVITTEEKPLRTYEKEQDSPTSDEFEMVDKPSEMDDFVVIEEVAKEAQETDPEGKSVQIKAQKYVKRHDTEIEEYLSKTTKKQESSSSASGSLSDEELLQYDLEQKKLQAQELAEIEAGKRWIQMQFEGDPRYDYERIPLEDIKEEEMTDFDASRIGSLSSQKESIGSCGSFRNSYGSLSESEMASRMRFRLKGENDDISISSLQEFENLERALMEQYQQHSSSSQDSLNGSLPRRYILSKSQGDDISISSLKEFEGLESACLEALKAELLAKQKEALLVADPKVVSGSFLEQEKRAYDDGSDNSPPFKSGSPGQKGGSPSQKSGSPSQKGGSPSQKVGSYGSPSQKLLADSAAIRKLIDQQLALEQRMQEARPKIITVKKFDDRGAFFVPEPESGKFETKPTEVSEDCKKASSFVCAAAPSDGSAESIPGDCEEMMKILDQEEKSKKQEEEKSTTHTEGGVIEIVRTQSVIQQKFIDGKKVSETITSTDSEGGVDIPTRPKQYDDGGMSVGSEISSSLASQPSEMDSLMTIIERHPCDSEVVTFSKHTIITSSEKFEDKPEDLEFSREGSAVRELSPSSGRSVAHSIISGKYFTDPASGSWSGQDEELSSSGSFSRARADLMLGSTDSLEATSSNATRATYNYEVDTPMTGSLTSGGSNTMVSSLDTLDAVTAVQMESLEHQSTISEHHSQEYEVHEPDSDTERLELDDRVPRAKVRTIMFDSTDTLSAVSGDGSVKEATVEAPAATFYIGDTPIIRGDRQEEEEESQPALSGSCPASLPPAAQSSPPIPAQRRSLSMIPKPVQSSFNGTKK
ncbi:ankyrin-2-like isoform X3 [Maniola hyperantus]|uniref:ankyrin-2-like isoform X3 n=1 Tax=Aphantopus hyperantus TaxID=2795564 RepID=UPI001568C761|nr:ankyrin-2-like [Maniola hyperantus]